MTAVDRMTTPRPRVTARISDAQAEALGRIAREERRRLPDLVRFALEEYIERRQTMAKTQEGTT